MNYTAVVHLDHVDAAASNVARLERKYNVSMRRDGFNPPTFVVTGAFNQLVKFCVGEFGENHGLMILKE
jgi:hypothetical protein